MQDITKLKKRINVAKSTIILVGVLTIANIVLIAFDADISFPFSAYIPQLVTFIFAELAQQKAISSLLYIGIAIAVLMALIYVALWFGAKKKNAFIIVALVFFVIDTVLFFIDIASFLDKSIIIDIVFHAWVVIDLIMGIAAASKLKKMPPEEPVDPNQFVMGGNDNQYYQPQNINGENEQNQSADC